MESRRTCALLPRPLGNGYPISVLAGREEIMRKIGRGVAHGGTYTAHSVSLAAAEKTLQILDETDALERIADYRHATARWHARGARARAASPIASSAIPP